MRTVCIVEARMRSTRLPGKVLLPVLGRPLLALMVERLRRSERLDDIVIATTEVHLFWFQEYRAPSSSLVHPAK